MASVLEESPITSDTRIQYCSYPKYKVQLIVARITLMEIFGAIAPMRVEISLVVHV